MIAGQHEFTYFFDYPMGFLVLTELKMGVVRLVGQLIRGNRYKLRRQACGSLQQGSMHGMLCGHVYSHLGISYSYRTVEAPHVGEMANILLILQPFSGALALLIGGFSEP